MNRYIVVAKVRDKVQVSKYTPPYMGTGVRFKYQGKPHLVRGIGVRFNYQALHHLCRETGERFRVGNVIFA